MQFSLGEPMRLTWIIQGTQYIFIMLIRMDRRIKQNLDQSHNVHNFPVNFRQTMYLRFALNSSFLENASNTGKFAGLLPAVSH